MPASARICPLVLNEIKHPHRNAVALHFMHCNFARIHKTLRSGTATHFI
jgi:hypothetical protein